MDMSVFRTLPGTAQWESEMAPADIDLIGVACGRGARNEGTRHGPAALRAAGLTRMLSVNGVEADWLDMLAVQPAANGATTLDAVAELCGRLADLTDGCARKDRWFSVIGGDHAIAIGTWAGLARARRERGPIGLIWVDAHMDSHTFETTPSGTIHGMPLAALMGHGAPELTELTGHAGAAPAIDPGHVCIVGVRSYEAGEAALLDRLGVRVIFMDEVRRLGLSAAMDQAHAIAAKGTGGFGVSFDLDAIDPEEAPGVGSPVPDGIGAADAAAALRRLAGAPGYAGFELVEFNPCLDPDGRTERVALDLLSAAIPIQGKGVLAR